MSRRAQTSNQVKTCATKLYCVQVERERNANIGLLLVMRRAQTASQVKTYATKLYCVQVERGCNAKLAPPTCVETGTDCKLSQTSNHDTALWHKGDFAAGVRLNTTDCAIMIVVPKWGGAATSNLVSKSVWRRAQESSWTCVPQLMLCPSKEMMQRQTGLIFCLTAMPPAQRFTFCLTAMPPAQRFIFCLTPAQRFTFCLTAMPPAQLFTVRIDWLSLKCHQLLRSLYYYHQRLKKNTQKKGI